MIDEYGYDEYGNYVGNMFVPEPDDDLGNYHEEDNAKKGFTYSDFSYDDFAYKNYVESQSVKNALSKATSAENALKKYADFTYGKQAVIDTIINQYLNREKFSYDFNSDALYQQYRDKYIKQGKLAMADTMGQAAAMTGGYGNSYAASAGNQAYQASLENLNDIVPELYAMALERYNQQGQELVNQYSMLSDDRNAAYSQWQDGYNRLVSNRDYYANRYDSERQWDYSKYSDSRDFAYNKYSSDRSLAYDEYSTDKNLSYQDYRNTIKDEQWETEQRRIAAQDSIENAQWEKEYERLLANDAKEAEQWQKEWDYMVSQDAIDRTENNAKTYHETGGKTGYDNGSVSPENIKEMQEALGVSADGKWGAGSTEAAGGLTADQAWKAYQNGTLGKPNITYEDIEDDLNYYISKGASKSEINSYLREALKSEYITQKEYNKLKELYTPRGQIYGPSLR